MRTLLTVVFISLCISVRAQFAVTDAANISQSIVNSTQEVAQSTTTATNMVKTFQETSKIYEQSKKFYDGLKFVHYLLRDAKKVQQTVLMVGEISDIYITNYKKMLSDNKYSVDELAAIAYGYSQLLQKSTDVLQELKEVVMEANFSMSDAERKIVIDKCFDEIRKYRNLVVYYTNKSVMVSYLRYKQEDDVWKFAALYGNKADKYW